MYFYYYDFSFKKAKSNDMNISIVITILKNIVRDLIFKSYNVKTFNNIFSFIT